ncbi:MAG: hypothetical protein ACLS7Z_11530 [Christensenellales bacterium]
MVGIAALFVLLFLLLFAMILPSRKKRSSNCDSAQRKQHGLHFAQGAGDAGEQVPSSMRN